MHLHGGRLGVAWPSGWWVRPEVHCPGARHMLRSDGDGDPLALLQLRHALGVLVEPAARAALLVVPPLGVGDVLAVDGDLDPVVGPANLGALEGMLARVLGVSGSATSTEEDGAVHAVYRDARGAPVLETWLVPGMAHAWSGGDARATHTWPSGHAARSSMCIPLNSLNTDHDTPSHRHNRLPSVPHALDADTATRCDI